MANNRKLENCIILFIVAILVRVLFYWVGLVKLPDNFQKFVTADTIFYYDPAAMNMALGNSLEPSLLNMSRFTFLGYLSMFYRYFGHVYWPVSIFHCFLGAMSVVILFLATSIFIRENIAFWVGLTAALHVVLVYWTPFVTTETAYLLILSLCLFLFSLFLKNNKTLDLILLLICLTVIFISRPQGLMLFLFVILYSEWLIFKRLFKQAACMCFSAVNVVILIMAGIFLFNSRARIDNVITQPYPQQLLHMSLYLDEMPEKECRQGYLRVSAARLSLPWGIRIPESRGYPQQILTSDILSYFKINHKKYIALVFLRFYTLFNPWVPEYSIKHNIFNVVFYGLIYLFSISGFIHLWKASRQFFVFILFILFSQIAPIVLTIVDYDFRLRLPIEFILTIPAGLSIGTFFRINKVSLET